jgi:PAS domain S-box-containing protein
MSPVTIGRLFAYAAIAAIFPVIAFRNPDLTLLRSGYEHALLDLAIALSACFCSLQSLLRYQSRPHPLFLWLGAGFLGTGLLDGLHAMFSLAQLTPLGEDRPGNWSWTVSSLMLAAYLALSLGQDRPAENARNAATNALIVGGVTCAAVAVLVFYLVETPLTQTVWPHGVLHRPYQLLPAIIMALAFALAWRRQAMLDPPLRRMLFIALALYIGLHAGLMAWSTAPLDAFVGLAHLAKVLAHWLILMGLLKSSANLLVQAESSRATLAGQAQALEESERHIRTIVSHAPYGIVSADEKGAIRDVNPFAASMFGLSQEVAIGRPLASLFDASVLKDLENTIGPGEQSIRARMLQERQALGEETQRTRRALAREVRCVRADGTKFPAALTLTDAVAGGQRFFTAFIRDLTRAVDQEQKIQQSLVLTTQILDQSSVAICSTDADGLITRFNRTAQHWLGYTEAEVVGRLTPAAFFDPAQIKEHGTALERDLGMPLPTEAEIVLAIARRGQTDQREWTLIRKDRSTFPAHVAVAAMADGGSISGFVLVATDLSHQKEVERMKSEFVSTVSHELRTPLTSVRGSLGLLVGGLAGNLPAQAQSLLDIAKRNTERLILLINDILDMEKIEAGKMRFNFKSVDLDVLAAEAVQSAEGYAATRGVRLKLRQRAPGLRVHADDQRLLQVLGNLLSNATKFSPEGATVEIDVADLEGRARVTVTDHGPGIPEGAQPRIFQKFFQADSSTTREKSGTGLGLSICKALVERMDGHLRFESRPGHTVFFFDLPRESALPAEGTGRRVLVVEDDPEAAAVIGRILGQAGFETDTVRTGAAAREQLEKRRYDCMTLDVRLPDGSGVDVLTELRRLEFARRIPVIIVSIHDPDDEMQAAATAAHVSDWLTKPIDSQRLLAALRYALPQSFAPAATDIPAAAPEAG